jgi:hypothetical protein
MDKVQPQNRINLAVRLRNSWLDELCHLEFQEPKYVTWSFKSQIMSLGVLRAKYPHTRKEKITAI